MNIKQNLWWLGSGIIFAGCIFKIYLWFTTGKCKDPTSMKGKTVIITGANSGIGKETAKELAKHNGRIILACRSIKKGMDAAKEIISATGNLDVIVKFLDLSSLKSVQTFAREIIETEERLDVLINNAGMAAHANHILTEDGIEFTLASNYFGHFVLTLLLLDLLKNSAPSRIINVSSTMYRWAKIDLEDLNLLNDYKPFTAYCNSKLANILHTLELSRRLKGTGVTINAVHPGAVNTNIMKNSRGLTIMLIKYLFFFFGKNATDGAQTSIFLAVSDEVSEISGKYFIDCKEAELSHEINYEILAIKLWNISKRLYENIEKEQLQNSNTTTVKL